MKKKTTLPKKLVAVLSTLAVATGLSTVAGTAYADSTLANRTYTGKSVVTVNGNKPSFSKKDLSKSKGAWQKYSNLDSLNRAGVANAMLNKKLMPTAKREPLYWNPTGWHNKRIGSGWLYNRCHLIGYQMTGQNNNPKNLITGTRQLNDPDMLTYENKVADYIRASKSHYVRYRVTPIFKGRELLARGVEMEAQSIESNAVRYHVYIYNVQPGVKLNYSTGTSVVSKSAKTASKSTASKSKSAKPSKQSRYTIKPAVQYVRTARGKTNKPKIFLQASKKSRRKLNRRIKKMDKLLKKHGINIHKYD